MRRCAVLLLLVVFSAGTPRAGEAPANAGREAIAKLQAMDLFPDLEKEGSDFHRAVGAEIGRIERDEPSFFKQPGWPVFVARRVASRLGVKPRTVAEIRASMVKAFGVVPEEIRQVHGIQIVEAKFGAGADWVDVLPQIAARVSLEGLVVDCDESLASTFADASQFERHAGEGDADYWKRQREMLAAAAGARGVKRVLRVTFEMHSEGACVAVGEGERLRISDEGEITLSKIAPTARVVQGGSSEVRVEKGSAKKKNATPPGDNGAPPAKTPTRRTQPR